MVALEPDFFHPRLSACIRGSNIWTRWDTLFHFSTFMETQSTVPSYSKSNTLWTRKNTLRPFCISTRHSKLHPASPASGRPVSASPLPRLASQHLTHMFPNTYITIAIKSPILPRFKNVAGAFQIQSTAHRPRNSSVARQSHLCLGVCPAICPTFNPLPIKRLHFRPTSGYPGIQGSPKTVFTSQEHKVRPWVLNLESGVQNDRLHFFCIPTKRNFTSNGANVRTGSASINSIPDLAVT